MSSNGLAWPEGYESDAFYPNQGYTSTSMIGMERELDSTPSTYKEQQEEDKPLLVDPSKLGHRAFGRGIQDSFLKERLWAYRARAEFIFQAALSDADGASPAKSLGYILSLPGITDLHVHSLSATSFYVNIMFDRSVNKPDIQIKVPISMVGGQRIYVGTTESTRLVEMYLQKILLETL